MKKILLIMFLLFSMQLAQAEWLNGFSNCRNIVLAETAGALRTNEVLLGNNTMNGTGLNLTGLNGKLANNGDLRIVNSSCGVTGSVQPINVTSSGANWALTIFPTSNFSANAVANYSVYWGNLSNVNGSPGFLVYRADFDTGGGLGDFNSTGGGCTLSIVQTTIYGKVYSIQDAAGGNICSTFNTNRTGSDNSYINYTVVGWVNKTAQGSSNEQFVEARTDYTNTNNNPGAMIFHDGGAVHRIYNQNTTGGNSFTSTTDGSIRQNFTLRVIGNQVSFRHGGSDAAGSGNVITGPETSRVNTGGTFAFMCDATTCWFDNIYVFNGNYSLPYDKQAIVLARMGDLQQPNLTLVSSSVNDTVSSHLALFLSTWSSNSTLVNWTFEFDNGNGTLYNTSTGLFSGTTNTTNATAFLNATVGSTIRWRFYVWNDANLVNATVLNTFVTTVQAPMWSNNRTNSTTSGALALIQTNWTDDLALASYIFEFDNGNGTLQNLSTGSLTGTANISNYTVGLNGTVGSVIRWRFYVTDADGGMNATLLNSFTTQSPSTPFSMSFSINKLNFTEYEQANVTILVYNITATSNLTANFSLYLQNGTRVTYLQTVSASSGNVTLTQLISVYDVQNGLNEYRNFSLTLNSSYIHQTATFTNSTSANFTATAFLILITNCSEIPSYTNATALRFYVREEVNDSFIYNATIDYAVTVYSPYSNWSRNYSQSMYLLNNYTRSLCIYPIWAVYTVNLDVVYSASGYSTRSYFAYTNFSNSSQTIDLYLLSSSLSSQVVEYVVDTNNIGVQGVIVKTQRWFTGSNSYKTVAQIETDYEGKGIANLQVNDVYYRFVLEANGTVITEIAPFVIICAQGNICPPYYVTLPLSELDIPNYFNWIGNLQYACSFNNGTGVFSCTINDPTGITVGAELDIDRKVGLNFVSNCTATCSTSACTLACSLGNVTGHFYQYRLYLLDSNDNLNLIASDTLDFTSKGLRILGDGGVFALLIMFLVTIMAFAYNPPVGLVAGLLTVGAGFVMGILPATFSAVIGLAAVVMLILWLRK